MEYNKEIKRKMEEKRMMNPAKIFQIKNAWDKFTMNHPKFPKFLQAAQQASIDEGTIIEIKITKENGDSIASNLKLTAEDMELFRQVSDLTRQP